MKATLPALTLAGLLVAGCANGPIDLQTRQVNGDSSATYALYTRPFLLKPDRRYVAFNGEFQEVQYLRSNASACGITQLRDVTQDEADSLTQRFLVVRVVSRASPEGRSLTHEFEEVKQAYQDQFSPPPSF